MPSYSRATTLHFEKIFAYGNPFFTQVFIATGLGRIVTALGIDTWLNKQYTMRHILAQGNSLIEFLTLFCGGIDKIRTDRLQDENLPVIEIWKWIFARERARKRARGILRITRWYHGMTQKIPDARRGDIFDWSTSGFSQSYTMQIDTEPVLRFEKKSSRCTESGGIPEMPVRRISRRVRHPDGASVAPMLIRELNDVRPSRPWPIVAGCRFLVDGIMYVSTRVLNVGN